MRLKRYLWKRLERITVSGSSFLEQDLMAVQNACHRYCAACSTSFSTEISLPTQSAVVYIHNVNFLGEREWRLLLEIEKHIEHFTLSDPKHPHALSLYVNFFS